MHAHFMGTLGNLQNLTDPNPTDPNPTNLNPANPNPANLNPSANPEKGPEFAARDLVTS